MTITASVLRKDIYQLLDQILATGIPLTVKRKSGIVKIVPEKTGSRFSRLKEHKCMKCDPKELVHMDWSGEWKP